MGGTGVMVARSTYFWHFALTGCGFKSRGANFRDFYIVGWFSYFTPLNMSFEVTVPYSLVVKQADQWVRFPLWHYENDIFLIVLSPLMKLLPSGGIGRRYPVKRDLAFVRLQRKNFYVWCKSTPWQ